MYCVCVHAVCAYLACSLHLQRSFSAPRLWASVRSLSLPRANAASRPLPLLTRSSCDPSKLKLLEVLVQLQAIYKLSCKYRVPCDPLKWRLLWLRCTLWGVYKEKPPLSNSVLYCVKIKTWQALQMME